MKIIASDYDGTLNYNGIDEKKKKALKKWHGSGHLNSFVDTHAAKGRTVL